MGEVPPGYLEQVAQFAFQAGRSGPDGIVRVRSLFDRESLRLRTELHFPSACQRGCASCCQRSVRATFPEVLNLMQHLAAQPVLLRKVEQRLREYVEKMTPVWERMAPATVEPCPLLDSVSLTCSVYDQRPLFCRGWSSSDVHACVRFAENSDTDLPPLFDEESQLCEALTKGLIMGVAAGGAPSGLYEMASALLLLLDANKPGAQPAPNALERLKVVTEQSMQVVPMPDRLKEESESTQSLRFKQLYIQESNWREAKNVLRGHSPLEAIQRMAFPRIHSSEDEIDGFFEDWTKAVDAFGEGNWDPLQAYEALSLHDTFPLAYTGRSVRSHLERHGEVLDRLMQSVAPELCEPPGVRTPGRIRMGYISGRLQDFNGARWALGWLKGHSAEVETYAFNLSPTEDVGSHAFRRLVHQYFHLPFAPLDIARHIRSLDLDLLIWTDIGMGGIEYQLAPLKLARRQATAWGHPVTSGLPSIDWYFSSEMMEPDGAEAEYTEELIRLPGSGLAYPPITGRPSTRNREDFGLGSGRLLVSCQNPMKYLARFDSLYAEIGERADTEIVFLGGLFKGDLALLKQRFRRAGIRAHWIDQLPARDYLRLIQLADVILDAPGWNGGNTTIEALCFGKPVVSLPTKFMRGRHAVAFLGQAGVPELLARDKAEYVSLALDPQRLAGIMEGAQPERIFMDPRPVREIERLVQRLSF